MGQEPWNAPDVANPDTRRYRTDPKDPFYALPEERRRSIYLAAHHECCDGAKNRDPQLPELISVNGIGRRFRAFFL